MGVISFCLITQTALGGEADPQASRAGHRATKPSVTLVRNVHVIPMGREVVLRNRSVLVRDDLIWRIGSEEEIATPDGARVIDGLGGFLIPGLMDMHVHLGMPPEPSQEEMAKLMRLFLAGGVTTIRNMMGAPAHIEIKKQVLEERVLGPEVYTASPVIAEPYFEGLEAEQLRERAAWLAKRWAEAGYDFIKHVRLDPELHKLMVEEAEMVGLPVAGHVPDLSLSLDELLEAGGASTEHFLEFLWISFRGDHDESLLQPTAKRVAQSGLTISTVLVDALLSQQALQEIDSLLASSTMDLPRRYFGEAGVSDLKAFPNNFAAFPEDWRKLLRADIAFALKFLVALDEAGASLVAGTDSRAAHLVPGFALHDELALFVRAGLSPYRALRTATVAPSTLLGISDRKGTVEEGKEADLVLLRDNPLSNLDSLREPIGVMVGGRWLDADDLIKLRRP